MIELLMFAGIAICVMWLGAHLVDFISNIFAGIQERWLVVEEKRAAVQAAWVKVQIESVGIERAQLDVGLVAPSAKGALPVSRKLLQDGQIVDAQLTLLAEDIATRRPVQPVPSNIHYAPHYARVTDAIDKIQAEPMDTPVKPIADFWNLYNAGAMPTNGFLMGYDLETNKPVIANWKQLYSALIGGTSGSGKSTLVRCVLAQSALQGGRFVVLDKHFGAGEESLGASLQPLRSRLVGDIAATDKQMLDAIKYVGMVGSQRLSGQDSNKSPLILVVDETTALLQRSDIAEELLRVLGQISQETRKVGVYALCIGQNFHGEIMKTTVRDSFVSFLTCRTRKNVARVMSGNNLFATAAESLKLGQAVWMDTSGNLIRMAVPNTTQEHIEAVAHEIDDDDAQDVEPRTEPRTAPRMPARIEQSESVDNEEANEDESVVTSVATTLVLDERRLDTVRRMIKSRATRNEILQEVWKVNSKQGGNKFAQAARELDEIIYNLVQ